MVSGSLRYKVLKLRTRLTFLHVKFIRARSRLKGLLLHRDRFIYFLAAVLMLPPAAGALFGTANMSGEGLSLVSNVGESLSYLLSGDVASFVRSSISLRSGASPLLAWLGLFFYPLSFVTGSQASALSLSSWLAGFVSLVLLYRCLSSVFSSRLSSISGVFLVASSPVFLGSTSSFVRFPFQLLGVTVVLYAARRSKSWCRARSFITLVAGVCVVALTGAVNLVHVAVAASVTLLHVLGRGLDAYHTDFEKDRAALVPLAFVSVLLMIVTAGALVFGAGDVVANLRADTSSVFIPSVSRGSFTSVLPLSFAAYGLALPPTLPALAACLLASVLVGLKLPGDSNPVVKLSLMQVIASVSFMAIAGFSSVFFLLLLLPYVSVLFAYLVDNLGFFKFKVFFISVLALQFLVVGSASVGVFDLPLPDFYLGSQPQPVSSGDYGLILENVCGSSDVPVFISVYGRLQPYLSNLKAAAASVSADKCLFSEGKGYGRQENILREDFVLVFEPDLNNLGFLEKCSLLKDVTEESRPDFPGFHAYRCVDQ